MKLLWIILTSVFTISTLTGGDDDPINKRIKINDYEPNLNLQYIGIEDSIIITSSKNSRKEYITNNIAVYDIHKNYVNYIFNDLIKRTIIEFHFESNYFEKFKTIEFNNSYQPYECTDMGLFKFSNNKNISSRPISNNLIIITKNEKTGTISIWTCDKYGNNLREVFVINEEWSWEIDVKNQMIRINRKVGQKIEIKNVRY